MKQLEDLTEPELRNFMNRVGHAIEDIGAESGIDKTLFCCLVFSDPKLSQYVSNCERPDIIKAMRECANRLENNQDVPR